MSPRLILARSDQLTPDLSAIRAGDRASDVVLMAKASYVRHD
jgi:hypothetical protein